MPTKPKTQVRTTEGTAIFGVLDYLLKTKEDEYNVETWVKLSELIEEKTGEKYSPDSVSQAVRWFNEGLYNHEGITLDQGEIVIEDLFKPLDDRKEVKNVEFEDLEQEKQDSIIEGYRKLCDEMGFKPEEAAGSYLKYENMTIRIPKKFRSNNNKTNKLIYEDVKSKLTDLGFFDKDISVVEENRHSKVGVVNVTDLHIGAFVRNLNRTPDFDQNVIKRRLETIAEYVNNLGFEVVRINLLGDILHSVTGRNHPNTFKECELDGLGPEGIILATDILHENFLSRINNLGKINMVGGNHGRLEESKNNDAKSGGENLIHHILNRMGYEVNFDPLVITERIDGIVYVLTHGDKGMNRRPTSEILWTYASDVKEEGDFCLSISGHLHSRISRMSAKSVEKFELVGDDSIDFRSLVLPSVFSGDSYSDDNLWFTCAGFVVTLNDGKGKPIVIDYPLH